MAIGLVQLLTFELGLFGILSFCSFVAAVNTSALNKYLKSTIKSVRPDEDHGFWIGGNRATKESDWHWIDGMFLILLF